MTGRLFSLAGVLLAAVPVAAAPPPDAGGGDAVVAPLPGDFPLPPLSFMLNPVGRPPGGPPPDTSDALSPSLALADAAVHAAAARCRAQGLRVAVVVLDAGGNIRAALATDGAPPGRVYVATRKGLGAIAFRMPTSRLASYLAAHPAEQARVAPGTALFGGAVPLIAPGGRLYGAVAAAGARTEQDEGCAAAGAEAIAARLPG